MNQQYQPYPNNYYYQQQAVNTGYQYNTTIPQNQCQPPQNYTLPQNSSTNVNNIFNQPVSNSSNIAHQNLPTQSSNKFLNIVKQRNSVQENQQNIINVNTSQQPQIPSSVSPQQYCQPYLQQQQQLQPPLQSPPQQYPYQPPPPPQPQQQHPQIQQPQQQQYSYQPSPIELYETRDIYDTMNLDCLKTSDLYNTMDLVSIGPTIKNNKLHLNADQKLKLIKKLFEKFKKFIDSFNELDEETFNDLYHQQNMEWTNLCNFLTSISSHLNKEKPYSIVKDWCKKYKKHKEKKLRQELMLNENLLVQHRDLYMNMKKIQMKKSIHELYDVDEVDEEEITEPTVNCQACMDDVLLRNAIVLGCKDHHTYCKNCFKTSFAIPSIKRNEIMSCPNKDNYKLTLDDFDKLYEDEPPDIKATLRQTYCNILDKNEFDKNYVGCPIRGCPGYIHKEDLNERACLLCSVCHFEFCPNCQKMHHGKTSCDDYAKLYGDYLKWDVTGRNERLRKKGIVIAATRDAEEKQRRRDEELKQRLRELQADENWKAQTCKYCPSCHRVVYKVDGCDSMVCGRNYHGGDVQNGCGNSFYWSKAQPYQPRTDFNPNNEDYKRNIPPLENNVTHNAKFVCSICKKTPIIGIRFKCLNCTDFYLCEECECKEEERNNHNKNEKEPHVFQLIVDPELE